MSDVFVDFVMHARPYLRAAAIAAARRLGLFNVLDCERDAETLAAAIGADARKLRALLDVLVLEGVVVRADNGEYRCSDNAAILELEEAALPPGGWARLAEAIRGGRAIDDPALGSPEGRARFHRHLAEAGRAAAVELAARLAAPGGDVPLPADGPRASRAGKALLDAGGGLGTYLAAHLDAAPSARGTLVDMPEVLDLARDHLAPYGARVRYVAADLTRDTPLPGDHDIALLCNVLHLHPPDVCAHIIARVARALRPGGRLVVKDLRVAADRSGPPAGLLFALNMALYTDGGDVYCAGEIAAWMSAAGLAGVREEPPLDAAPDAVVVSGVLGGRGDIER